MKCSISKKLKALLVIALTILVAGFTVLGVFGFNNTSDFEKSYEVSVSITQNHDGSGAFVDEVAKNYFEEKDASVIEYATQVNTRGTIYIYKFAEINGVDQAELNTLLTNQLDNKYGVGAYIATVNVDEVVPALVKQVGWVALALGVSVVAIFIYMLIVEKLAAALSTVLTSVTASVFFIALMAICRIPAEPFIVAAMATTAVLAGILTSGTVNRFKEEIRLNEKATKAELAKKVAKDSLLRHALIAILVALVSIVLIAVGPAYLRFIGLQLLLAGVVSVLVAYVCAPLYYLVFKK